MIATLEVEIWLKMCDYVSHSFDSGAEILTTACVYLVGI